MKAIVGKAFAALLVLSLPRYVEAAVLAAGNDTTSLIAVNTPGITSGAVRSQFTTIALTSGNASASDPYPNGHYKTVVWPATSADFWFSARAGRPDNTCPQVATSSNSQHIMFYDAAGVMRLAVRGTGTNGQVKISKRNSAGTFTDLVTSAAGAVVFDYGCSLSPQKWDIHVVYAVAGSVTLYQNGVQVATYSGDVTTDSATALAQAGMATGCNCQQTWSEVIVAEEDTRAFALFRIPPANAGVTQSWSGSSSNINKTTVNDSTFNSSGTSNQISGWKNSSLSFPTGAFTVKSFVTAARIQKGTSGPSTFAFHCRPGSTDIASSDVSVTTAFDNYAKIWATNCDTAAAWSTSDFTTTFEFGVKSRP